MKWLQVLVLLAVFLGVGWAFFGNTKVVVVRDNHKQEALPVTLGQYQDAHCGMIINDLQYGAQIVLKDGKTYFFMDLGGVVLWLKDRNLQPKDVKIWVYAKDTKKWVVAQNATFARENTPMHYNFAAYEKIHHNITFEEFWKLMYYGEWQK